MRLIDADALLEKMDAHCKLCPDSDGVHVCRRECDWHEAMDEVDDMDEIDLALLKEEPKQGRWITYPESLAYEGAYSEDHIVCSECESVWSIMDNDTETFDCCPHCGAKMEED